MSEQPEVFTVQEEVDIFCELHKRSASITKDMDALKTSLKSQVEVDHRLQTTDETRELWVGGKESVDVDDKDLIALLEEKDLLESVTESKISTKKVKALAEVDPDIAKVLKYKTSYSVYVADLGGSK